MDQVPIRQRNSARFRALSGNSAELEAELIKRNREIAKATKAGDHPRFSRQNGRKGFTEPSPESLSCRFVWIEVQQFLWSTKKKRLNSFSHTPRNFKSLMSSSRISSLRTVVRCCGNGSARSAMR